MILSVGVAVLIDKADDKINRLDDVKDIFDAPVLGRIPVFSEENNIKKEGEFSQLPLRDLPTSIISEAYNFLFTGIKLLFSQNPPKTIVMSSCVPGEGKSTTAANLAIAATEIGSKVLLIECDLRKPTQKDIWGIKPEQGMIALLNGQIEIEDALVSTVKNVDVLVAEKPVTKPLNLISSKKMNQLLDYADKNYDFIIVDCPPFTVGAETPVLGRMTDGLLMVSRLGKITRSIAKNNKEMIEGSDVKLLGLVFNGTSPKDKYGYYKDYYYISKQI